MCWSTNKNARYSMFNKYAADDIPKVSTGVAIPTGKKLFKRSPEPE